LQFAVRIPFIFLLVLLNLTGSICSARPRTPAPATRNQGSSSSTGSATAAPTIANQPTSQSVSPSQPATFTVTATGATRLTYQWMRNGAPIPGAISPVYTISAAGVEDNGALFSVTISNSVGKVSSGGASLTVNPASATAAQSAAPASAQNQQVRTSRFLSNSYIGVQVGRIGYAFSNAQLLPGFQAQSIQIGHSAVRFVLFGHEFNKYLSGQISEMIPLHSVTYKNINGFTGNYPLWINNIAGFTVKGRLPLNNKWSLFAEGGLGIVTRNAITVNHVPAANSANYAAFLFGGGVAYRLNEHWDLLAAVIDVPGHSAGNQPSTQFVSGGFDYTMRRVPADPDAQSSPNSPIWPRNMIQVGYISNALSYDVNDFFTKGKVAIFWHGSVEVRDGVSVEYRRNLFHTRRFFALDLGTGVSSFRSRINGERFYAIAIYPALRIPLIRTKPAEFYFTYSLAGPSLLTRTTIDNQNTGRVFTFQDYMGLGMYLTRKRRVTAEVRIQHYSNANLFPHNPGITVPLGFYMGTTF